MRHTFTCIDGHTCGNPVRVVAAGGPDLAGNTMMARRDHFLRDYDWIRTGLMFEPRGHDMMSGAILYPPMRPDCDAAILFIETSGCLPMCGHGTIGAVTIAIENGLIKPHRAGLVRLETPAGIVEAHYEKCGGHVDSVRIVNVPAYRHAENVRVDVAGLGPLAIDVAYGGNFYAIVDHERNGANLDTLSAADILRLSPLVRTAINAAGRFVHPRNTAIDHVSHVLWTGEPRHAQAQARNAVFYGARAIDRSPCGTGTSARMAQWAAQGRLKPGDVFHHESIIGSLFRGRIEAPSRVGNYPAIIPSIEGWARVTGFNTIIIDDRDPYAHGFQLAS